MDDLDKQSEQLKLFLDNVYDEIRLEVGNGYELMKEFVDGEPKISSEAKKDALKALEKCNEYSEESLGRMFDMFELMTWRYFNIKVHRIRNGRQSQKTIENLENGNDDALEDLKRKYQQDLENEFRTYARLLSEKKYVDQCVKNFEDWEWNFNAIGETFGPDNSEGVFKYTTDGKYDPMKRRIELTKRVMEQRNNITRKENTIDGIFTPPPRGRNRSQRRSSTRGPISRNSSSLNDSHRTITEYFDEGEKENQPMDTSEDL